MNEGPIDIDADLLSSLADCSREFILPLVHKSFRNGPCPLVFSRPERPAWMDEERLGVLVADPIYEKASASRWHSCL